MSQTKFCPKCKKVKSLDEFYRRSKAKDKLQGYCKACSLESNRRYLRTEKSKEYHKRYNRSEKGKARRRRFYIRHPYYLTEYGTPHYNALRERNRKWGAAHPHAHMERYHRLQERFGYHGGDVEAMFPGLKFIEAFKLGNYKVVKS